MSQPPTHRAGHRPARSPLERLERRVAALEAALAAAPATTAPTERETSGDERFWALDGLRRRVPSPGGVVFTGTVDLPDGGHVDWQWGEPTDALLGDAWDGVADRLDALAHPVRLELLRHVLSGARSAAELTEVEAVGTTGQLYHHLRPLLAVGWLRQTGRGRYQVPAERVVPLLVVLAAVRA